MEKGSLYIVATPIGNLEDITLRAIRVLKSVDLIAAEDTRRSSRLLRHYEISTPTTSYHDFTRAEKRERILGLILEGKDVALISDAGTPGISDPGYRLVGEALSRGISVSAVPGPSVLTAALSVSGLATDCFYFTGYLPNRARARAACLRALKSRPETLVLYETPRRILASLQDMLEILGNRRIAVIREMTKLHEEIFRGRVEEAQEHLRDKTRIRGEITLVVEGAPKENVAVRDLDLAGEIRKVMHKHKVSKKEAVRIVAETRGLPRNRVYKASLNLAADR